MREADPTRVTSAFDATSVETFEGQIVGIDRVDIDASEAVRPALVVRFIGNGEFPRLYLGPADFMSDYDIEPRILDYAEVTASRITTVPGLEFIVREIKIGDKSVTLRDGLGQPYWQERGAFSTFYGGAVRMPSPPPGSPEDSLRDQINLVPQPRQSSR